MTSIEGLGLGTLFSDIYYGDNCANFLWIDGADTAFGRGGDDMILVGSIAGASINGNSGNDLIIADNRRTIVNAQGMLELVGRGTVLSSTSAVNG